MTKRFSILQKKLQELELVLSEAFSLPPDTDTQYQRFYFQDIEQRFFFLKTLLSAEVASSPTKPHHLQHIGKRLAELETAFLDWDKSRASALQGHLETASTCSCTESCLNDDGDETVIEDPVNVLEELNEGKGQDEAEKTHGVEEMKSDLKGRERGVSVGSLCGGVACGVAIGMALMGLVMVRFCGCVTGLPHTVCLTPT